jgi:hypothetical protein
MFCPHCGYEVTSERVRFCTQCRFPIGSLKEFIATETAKYEAEDAKESFPLRQLDINVGAAFMIASVIISLIVALNYGKWFFGGLAVFIFMFGSLFSLFLLFSRRTPRRRGLSLGAILVSIGNLIATIFADKTEGISFLIVAALVIPVILLWLRIVRFFFDVDTKPARSDLNAVEPFFNASGISTGSALPPAQILATADLNTQPVKKKQEEGVRFSVTEDPTELLK